MSSNKPLLILHRLHQKASFSALLKSRDSSSSSPTSSGSSESSSPSSSTRSIQPTPSQRRYAAVFSKITFSNAEFIEDRYIYSQSPEKTDGHFRLPTQEPVPTEELMIPCPSFFAIPASRQPSVIEQSDIRLDQTTNPTEHRISFCGLSDSASPNSPLRSCFQEIFDLIDAGMSDEQFDDIIGDDISYEARNLPTAPASDSPYGLSGASGSNATLRLHQPDSSDEPLSHLVEAATIDEPVIAPECADAEKPIVAIEPSEECTTGESIQAFFAIVVVLIAKRSDRVLTPDLGMGPRIEPVLLPAGRRTPLPRKICSRRHQLPQP
ncbi:hypothetical protein Pst134EB_010292 [Puccinia striiformis f. sp. tritici]|nr:hypothetical protein Pst134EB_010292 [Puccinia striiformis f. sp. tritici]